MQNILFYVDIVREGINKRLIIFCHLNNANTGTFDFVLKERPNIGFSFVLA